MRSHYVYIAWAVVIGLFVWQVYNPPQNPYDYYYSEIAREFESRNPDAPDIYDGQPLGVIGDDERVMLAEFSPNDVPWSRLSRDDYRASGFLLCGDSFGSASLVHRHDIIVFSAHQILKNNGARENYLSKCRFVLDTEGGESFALDLNTLQTGNFAVRSDGDYRFEWRATAEDWAVVKLKRPVEDVDPYQLIDADTAVLSGARVANVTAATDSWPDKKYGGRLAQICTYSGNIPGAPVKQAGRFDCDSGRGASGSGILAHDGDDAPRFFGVVTDVNRGYQKCESIGDRSCFTAGPLLHNKLREAIEALAPTQTSMLYSPAATRPKNINQPTTVLDLNSAKH